MVRYGAAALLTILVVSDAHAQLRTRVHASGFTSPIAFVQDPTAANVQFVAEQGGRIRVVRDGSVLPADFLDLRGAIATGGERGLLGLVFDPAYPSNRRFFVNFTNPSGHTVVARFLRSSGDPVVADASSRFDLRWNGASAPALIEQPFSNHNGGHLAFGPDGRRVWSRGIACFTSATGERARAAGVRISGYPLGLVANVCEAVGATVERVSGVTSPDGESVFVIARRG
jgi:glucose/arabinose dehydrogenase